MRQGEVLFGCVGGVWKAEALRHRVATSKQLAAATASNSASNISNNNSDSCDTSKIYNT